jgi:hypothetical protein
MTLHKRGCSLRKSLAVMLAAAAGLMASDFDGIFPKVFLVPPFPPITL